jgi:lipopolysaccharide transport system ATP-binding protein
MTSLSSSSAGASVRLEEVWKAYPRWPAGHRTLRGIVSRRAPRPRGGSTWALRGVSLEATTGRALGIIGANGAGKTTVLRLAARLGRPTRGRVASPPGTASVLALGDTFEGVLSGAENARTAAIIAGFSRAEAGALLPAIFDFAELEDVANEPVRTYSSGMKLRLAFAVVAQLRPRALLVDEVLAVGDLAFQARCMQRMRELRDAGTTLVIASHDLRLVERECDDAIWLDRGTVAGRGDARAVVGAYEHAARERALAATPIGSEKEAGELRLGRNRAGTQQVTAGDVRIEPARALRSGEPLRVDLVLRRKASTPAILDPNVQITITRLGDEAVCLEADTASSGTRVGPVGDCTELSLEVSRLDLMPGRYAVDVGVYSADWETVYDHHWRVYRLDVTGTGGGRGTIAPPLRWLVRQ